MCCCTFFECSQRLRVAFKPRGSFPISFIILFIIIINIQIVFCIILENRLIYIVLRKDPGSFQQRFDLFQACLQVSDMLCSI